MGNDEQINQHDMERGKSLFLPPEIEDIDGAELVAYSLEEEYKKSKRNVAWKVYIVLGVFVGLLGLSAYGANMYFRYTDSKKEIVVTEFEGENLKDVLNKTRSAEKNLAQSKESLLKLQEDMRNEIAAIKADGERKRTEIQNLDLSHSEKSKLLSEQKQSENNQLEAVALKYEKLIDEKEKEVSENEKRVKESREQMDAGVSKANQRMSNAERLTQMRLDQQKSHYEDLLRQMLAVYDPSFSNKDVKKILRSNYQSGGTSDGLRNYSRDMKIEGNLSEDEFVKLKSLERDFNLLIRESKKIPYRNSMSRTLRHIDGNYNAVIDRYERFADTLLASNKWKRSELNSYNYAFEHLTKTSPETGYIVDARNSNEIVVYVNPVVRLNNGHKATVFRRDDEQIGVIEFLPGKNRNIARVISLVPDKKLQPFDRVLIEYNR